MLILEVVMMKRLILFSALAMVFCSCLRKGVCKDDPRSWSNNNVVVSLEEPKIKSLKILEPAWTPITQDDFIMMLNAVSEGDISVIEIKDWLFEVVGVVNKEKYHKFIEQLNTVSTYKRTSYPGFSSYKLEVRIKENQELIEVRFVEGLFHETTILTSKTDPKPKAVHFETNAREFIYDLMSACEKKLEVEGL